MSASTRYSYEVDVENNVVTIGTVNQFVERENLRTRRENLKLATLLSLGVVVVVTVLLRDSDLAWFTIVVACANAVFAYWATIHMPKKLNAAIDQIDFTHIAPPILLPVTAFNSIHTPDRHEVATRLLDLRADADPEAMTKIVLILAHMRSTASYMSAHIEQD